MFFLFVEDIYSDYKIILMTKGKNELKNGNYKKYYNDGGSCYITIKKQLKNREEKMTVRCKKKMEYNAGMAISFCIGVAAFFLYFGWKTLPPSNIQWIINSGEADLTTHYSAWTMYRNSAWTFPLGYCQKLLWPSGKTITYADTIPIISIVFKIFRNFLPNPLQYFGLWILFCFGMQSLFGYKIVALFTNSIFSAVCASLLFVMFPPMINRAFDHCALTAHWIILVGLYLYIKSIREKELNKLFILLTTSSIGVHPYFIPFTFFFVAAYLLSVWDKNSLTQLWDGLKIACICLFSTLLFGFIIGAFYGKNYSASIDVGWRYGDLVNSTNLNTWINPHNAFGRWSVFLKEWPEIASQTGGFSYLGLGVLILLSISLILTFKSKNYASKWKRKLYVHKGIVIMSVIFIVYAVGPLITFGDNIILEIPFPEKLKSLCSVFRAGGRFLWVVDYIVITTGVVSFLNSKSKQKVLILILLSVIQLTDISPALVKKRLYLNECFEDNTKNGMKSDFWLYLEENYGKIVGVQRAYGLPNLAAWGYRNGMEVSINSLARGITKAQEEFNLNIEKNVRKGIFDADTIYFIEDKMLFYELAYEHDDIYAAYVDDWFPIIVKKKDSIPSSFDELAVPYDKNNIRVIRGYSQNGNWISGVLEDKRSIILPNVRFIKEQLKDSITIVSQGEEASIISWKETKAGIEVKLKIAPGIIEKFNYKNALLIK